MMMPSTRSVTILPNAAPMITPTARSMTLPCARNWRNSFHTAISAPPEAQLYLDLNAQFDDALGGQPEEGGRADRVPRHKDEQLFAPDRHAAAVRHEDRLATEEVRHIVGV